MNKEQRAPYLALTEVWTARGTFPMCAFCRYAGWSGRCADAELDCQHPLEVIAERCYEVWESGDCWGFRPKVAPDVAADIVGIWLQGKAVNWTTVPLLGKKATP